MKKQYSFDSKCLDLAEHFYPEATKPQLDALAQQLQDATEDFAQEIADWKEDDGI